MLVSHEFLQHLKQFGLNSYEAKLWVSLLSRGSATAGELADMATVPRSRSYDVLSSLEQKGFITHTSDKPLRYVVIPPEEVMDRLKNGIKQETQEQLQALTTITKTSLFKELETMHEEGSAAVEPLDQCGYVKGRTALQHQLTMMVAKAQESVLFYGHAHDFSLVEPSLLNRKDITIKCCVHGKVPSSSLPLRQAKHGKARFLLVDKSELLLLPLDGEKTHPAYDYGIWSVSPLFASALYSFFEKACSKG